MIYVSNENVIFVQRQYQKRGGKEELTGDNTEKGSKKKNILEGKI